VRGWRWRRVAGALAAALVLLVVAAVGGIAWYFSSLAVSVDHSTSRPATAWPGPDGTVTISKHHEAGLPGRYGLEWDGGYGTVTAITATTAAAGVASSLEGSAADGTVTRRFTPGTGTLTPGTRVLLDSTADRGRTWVVFVHGHDSNRQESLRYLTALHRLRLPVLVVTYRNDVGAVASPDGIDHLGETEWRDVAAALTWAQHSGARDVVLAGWSMGGAVSLQAWDRGGLRGFVRGMVLDSPVLSWRDVLMFQGGERGLPSPVTDLALRVMQLRSGIDLDRLDWVARERELTVPMLVFASDDDTYVPDGPAKQLAADRPDLVTFVNVPGADHTRSWNVDPTAYEARLTQWLNAVAATSS
jgi:uncharacterized protein